MQGRVFQGAESTAVFVTVHQVSLREELAAAPSALVVQQEEREPCPVERQQEPLPGTPWLEGAAMDKSSN